MDEQISVRQAYTAMYAFLEELYSKYEFDQLGSVLGGLSLLADGSPVDQAAWSDWLRAVERAKGNQVDMGLHIRQTSK